MSPPNIIKSTKCNLTNACSRIAKPLRALATADARRYVRKKGIEMNGIVVVYDSSLPDNVVSDLKDTLPEKELDVHIESRPPLGPMACLEWMIPSAIMVMILQPYFKSFMSEMGKDHYNFLKKSLSSLVEKVMSRKSLEPRFVVSEQSPGKVNTENPYSLLLSLLAEVDDKSNKKFKLMIPKDVNNVGYDRIVDVYLTFLSEFYSGKVKLEDIGYVDNQNTGSNQILLFVDEANGKIAWLNVRAIMLAKAGKQT